MDPLPPESPERGAAWITAARDGSPEALGAVLELCRRYLLQIADTELDAQLQIKVGASDIVQETFLEAQRVFDRFQGTAPAELRAWLRAILLNKLATCARQYRATAKRQLGKEVQLAPGGPGEPAATLPSPSKYLMQEERAAALNAALQRLPEHYRHVILWRQMENLSFEAMAARLGRSAEAVRKLWGRAILQLQHELRDSL